MSAETVDVGLPDTDSSTAPPAVEESAITPVPLRSETDRLDSEPEETVLLNGMHVEIEPLRLRQFLRLLRIVTRGGASMMAMINPDPESPAFAQELASILLFAIPEAEDETVAFVQTIVKPADLVEGATLTKSQRTENSQKIVELAEYLENPELEDLLTIIQKLIEQEAEDLRALGKRLAAMFKAAQKMGQAPSLPQTPTS